MKIVGIQYKYQPNEQIYLFATKADAEAMYQAVKIALQGYKPFGNEKGETICVASSTGEITIKLENVVTVGIVDTEKVESAQIEWSQYLGRIHRRQ